MGYFSNGSEAMNYEYKYCQNCIHFDDCQILVLQDVYNYEEANNKDSILHKLIPMDEKGNNKECTMFKEDK